MTHPKEEENKRDQVFVDPQVQGALILRVVLYWTVCMAAVTLMLLCWRVATGPMFSVSEQVRQFWAQFGPAMIVSAVLLPIVVYDILQMSNRFCGPVSRLRRSLRALARGEHVDPISFRGGDFWKELAHEFNTVAARVQREPPPPGWEVGESEPHEASVAE
jgi:hypothetical protein